MVLNMICPGWSLGILLNTWLVKATCHILPLGVASLTRGLNPLKFGIRMLCLLLMSTRWTYMLAGNFVGFFLISALLDNFISSQSLARWWSRGLQSDCRCLTPTLDSSYLGLLCSCNMLQKFCHGLHIIKIFRGAFKLDDNILSVKQKMDVNTGVVCWSS